MPAFYVAALEKNREGRAFEPRAAVERCDAVGFAFAYYLVGTALWARFGPGLVLGEGGDEGVVLTYVRTAVCCCWLPTSLPTYLHAFPVLPSCWWDASYVISLWSMS